MPSSISSRLRSRSRPRGARSSAISMLPVSLRDVRLGAAYGCGEDRWTAVPDRSRSASDAARIGRWHGGGTAPHPGGSELQAAFARGVGQGLDAPMIPVTGASESNRFDAGGLRLLGDRAAEAGGGLGVLAARQAVADVGLGGAGRGQHLRAVGGEHLGVEVLAGAQHRQARHAEFADVRARGLGTAQAGNLLLHGLVLRKLKALLRPSWLSCG